MQDSRQKRERIKKGEEEEEKRRKEKGEMREQNG